MGSFSEAVCVQKRREVLLQGNPESKEVSWLGGWFKMQEPGAFLYAEEEV